MKPLRLQVEVRRGQVPAITPRHSPSLVRSLYPPAESLVRQFLELLGFAKTSLLKVSLLVRPVQIFFVLTVVDFPSFAVPNAAPVAQPQPQPKAPPKNRRPEELDALAAQLNDLGAATPNPPGVEDDDSDEDSSAPPAGDGTLLASDPPKPL